ncbi:MAG: gliding motility-associated C-terminal domain-containing protein [Bacteroidota bacterium]
MKLKFLSLLLLFACFSMAQNEGNIWYFGDHAGLDFNGSSPVALTNGALSTIEGCATISTNAGMLRFYTDGITVWNNTHTPMPNGNSLSGDLSATQSALIIPKPGNINIYYIFTVTALGLPNGLRYSEVNMALAGGLGDVTTNKNIPLASPVTEKLTAVKNANNIDIWVIAHDLTTNAFLVYSVTSAGVNTTPIISNAGSTPGIFPIGYLKASANGSKLAQAISSTNSVDILNFSNITGLATSDFTFTTPFSSPNGVYGIEFSPNGTRLYITAEGFFDIYQYDMTLSSTSAIIASATLVGSTSGNAGYLYALQAAPDGKIYVAKHNSGALGSINNPNAQGVGCNFVDSAVYLSGKISKVGLPNFSYIFFNPPSIIYVNTCVSDTTFFSLSDTTTIDSVLWNFNDPVSAVFNTSPLLSPQHIYTSAGIYIVSVIIHSGYVTDTVMDTINISSIPVANFSVFPFGAINPNTEVLFINGSTAGSSLFWNFDDSLSAVDNTSSLLSPGHIYSKEGTYCITLTASNLNNCIDSVFYCLIVEYDNITIPNVFSPNGDGINDIFFIEHLHLGIAAIKIYNRWGETIYESSGYNNDWNGKSVSEGIYYYTIDYPLNNKTYTGFIHVLY